jgi:CheY-like chemotaxis protein
VLNIAVNARDAMAVGGGITLTVRNRPELLIEGLHGDFVELSVADTGGGMSPETVKRVFEPFFTTKDVGKGTGLGLSQVYGFSRASGGVARIESDPGQGTTVSIFFPYSNKPLTRAALAAAPALQAAKPGRVLLVEDDDTVAAAVEGMLQELGYQVTRARDALSGLHRLEADPTLVDLVFSDMVMPGPMDGAALAEEIRRRWPKLPVVLTTGFSDAAESATQKGLRLITKPYRLETLAVELAAATAKPKGT